MIIKIPKPEICPKCHSSLIWGHDSDDMNMYCSNSSCGNMVSTIVENDAKQEQKP